jgi:competence protein ComGC
MRQCQPKLGAFTLIELIVLIGIIVLLAGVLIPGGIRWRQKKQRIQCVSHLKQIGLSFRLWPSAQNADLPMVVSTNRGGTLEVENEVWRSMLVMSNELGTPLILACPSDSREPAANFAALSNSNISYFIGLDAPDSMPEAPLVGDRFLSVGREPTNKVLTIGTNDVAVWGGRNHQGGGNMAVADGSVRQYTSEQMYSQFTNAMRLNWQANGNAMLRLAMPE